jgi:hypothetical protein
MLRLVSPNNRGASAGLDQIELVLFVGGVLVIGLFMALFLQPLSDPIGLIVLAGWLIGGLAYVRWLHQDLARRPPRRRPPG